MMKHKINNSWAGLILLALSMGACKLPHNAVMPEIKTVPTSYNGLKDTNNIAQKNWQQYFNDPYLLALIDTALQNNQELQIVKQEIEIARYEVRARKGEYLPFVGLNAGAGMDKVPRYTNIGAMESQTQITPGKDMPEPVPDYKFGLSASWELDIWKKLRNARKAALARYLASVEGKNFMKTQLVAEVAEAYYELVALDKQLTIVKNNVKIQSDALEIVKLQKIAARTTELAVRKFEAEVFKTRSLQFTIQQKIVATENHLNVLLGRYPQNIERDDATFETKAATDLQSGLPSQLLENRPDIKQAEQNLAAAKLDVKVAKARFYPSLGISAATGFRAFNPSYLLLLPESVLYNLAGDLAAPLINRNAIKASYFTANAKQIQALLDYQQVLIKAYAEVLTQQANIQNLEKYYDLRSQQVDALTESIKISGDLFKSARADYMEILMTQRDALEAKFELVETKLNQFNAMIALYRSLGGGWK